MANQRHLELLEEGVDAWNEWARRRTENVDLRDADLTGRQLMGFDFSDADLKRAKLRRANLRKAKFSDAYLRRADLTGADLTEASMRTANCRHAVLRGATLKDAYLRRVDLSYVDLRKADLTGANLEYARLVDVNLSRATLKNCFIYGISVWNVVGTPKEQSNLIITPSRAVNDDKAIPFVPILQDGEKPFAMFKDLKQKYGTWVLNLLRYDSPEGLLRVFDSAIIEPAIKKEQQLLAMKAEDIGTRHVRDYATQRGRRPTRKRIRLERT